MVMQCKAVLQQSRAEEVRRFELHDKNFSQLQRVISQIFPALSEAQFAVFWEDDDDDFVSISSNEELRIAIQQNSSEPMRFFVKTAEKCSWSLSSQTRFGTPTHRSCSFRSWFGKLENQWCQMKRKNAISCEKSSVSGPRSSHGELTQSEFNPFEAIRSFVLSLMSSFGITVQDTRCSNAALEDTPSGEAEEKEAEAIKASAPSQARPSTGGTQHPDPAPQTWRYGAEVQTGLNQPPRGEQAAQPPRGEQATQPPRGEHGGPTPEPPMYGQEPLYPVLESHVTTTVQQLRQMGFSDEGGWLTQLVVAKDGDVGRVLDELQPNGGRR